MNAVRPATARQESPGHRPPRRARLALALALCTAVGCSAKGPSGAGLTASTHRYFPIASGTHALDCASCHTSDATFTQFTCVACHAHDQGPIDLVHNSVVSYAFTSAGCYECHPAPTRQPFSHAGITGNCAFCHDVGASFAALPVTGFTHQDTHGADCSGCHGTASWNTASEPGGLVFDPARDLAVTGLVPSYAGNSITALTPLVQVLHMDMDHAATALDAATLGNCGACHVGAASGVFYPGVLHSSLANQGLPQPATCAGCHGSAAPAGFVGPLAAAPARQPPSGEMKHDAVAWAGGGASATSLLTADCSACHASPSAALQATWATGPGGAGGRFHASLDAAGLAQPASCLDCHANTRPAGTLTSSTAALPASVTFDHGQQAALGDCAACHVASAAGWASWSGARWHLAGGATPSTCLPCHAGERPASAAGWVSTSFTASPFDYGTNAAGITHGDGQDCAGCHAGPGTGAWGGTQNWVGGHFAHGAGTVAATTCSACHASQRPDLQPGTTAAAMAALLGFDHALNGTGDCAGCHQATVTAGRYLHYGAPSTGALPGGDWAGGTSYPGAQLISAPDSIVTLTELTLTRSGGLVTGFTSTSATLDGAMSHVSAAIPGVISPGPASSPDTTTCWHCHTNVNGTVTSYAGGKFHAALASYAATPGGAVTPLPQPTGHCADCHGPMRPTGVVEAGGSALQPMDHAALFTATADVGGVAASGAGDLDCSACHARPGDTWTDGVFHARIGGAVPADCTVCHYPLMASAAADASSGALYAMRHRSALVTVQRCDACHAGALSSSTGTPAAALWRPGAYHASLASQPAACLDCHAGSVPAGPTQGSVVYALALGGTATNGAQWMSHAVAGVAGVDCVFCHAADATAGAWRKSTAFHAVVRSPSTCQGCHGLGAAPGSGDNRPSGLTNSSTLTTASGDASTGVPAGTYDQLTHADVNATLHDCGFCHTQAGPSSVAGVQGHEWAQARFHASFSAATPLVLNGTTGRCSDCHLDLKPGAGFTAQDHSTFTNAAGSQDCSACHSWPGTGTASAPNWLGAGGAPQYIAVGGFTVPRPPAATATTQGGIANLPHPGTATTSCATCHAGGAGGKGAQGYDHASSLITSSCDACHEAGSNLLAAPWNGSTTQAGGAGDTRPFTLASLRATRGGDSCTVTAANHFYPVDCYQCHPTPAGTGATTSGAAYTAAWTFPHVTSLMSNPATCNLCHTGTSCPK